MMTRVVSTIAADKLCFWAHGCLYVQVIQTRYYWDWSLIGYACYKQLKIQGLSVALNQQRCQECPWKKETQHHRYAKNVLNHIFIISTLCLTSHSPSSNCSQFSKGQVWWDCILSTLHGRSGRKSSRFFPTTSVQGIDSCRWADSFFKRTRHSNVLTKVIPLLLLLLPW